jgi:MFS family permease
MMLTFAKPRYFDGNLKQGFVALYSGKTISGIAISLFGVFMPIYLYKISGNNFTFVALYFLAGYLSYGLLAPFGAKALNRLGYRRALQVSVLFGALSYLVFYPMNQANLAYLVPLSVIIVLVYRLLFWLPYNVDFAKFTDRRNRGREVGFTNAIADVVGIFAPIVAAFIIVRFGFGALLVLSTIIYLASLIPYAVIPDINEYFSWSYWHTIEQLFSKKRRATVFAFAANGAEDALGAVVWPIFIYQLLHGNLLKVGLISTLIIGATILLELIVGKYADVKFPKEVIIKYGSIMAALGWIFKIFIFTAFQIFIVDSYHRLMKIFMMVPFDALSYEIMADQGHYIDEFSVVHDMAISLGRVLMVSAIIVAAMYVSIQWTFVLGAFASIALNFLRGKQIPIVQPVAI